MSVSSKRLVFEDSQHCGRTKELKVLTTVLERLEKPEIVFIKGLSGSGKSSLVSAFRNAKVLKRSSGYYFLSGKYDENVQQDPFAVIFGTIEMLCQQIVENGQEELLRLQNRIPESVAKELHVLTSSVPNLAKVFGTSAVTNATTESSPGDAAASSSNMSAKINYLFVKLLQCLSTEERPVVLFLDDLQWINRPSLDLLQLILTDAKLDHFMFLGSYRSEDIDGEQNQQHLLHGLFHKLEDYDKKYTTIHVNNLSLDDVCDYVARVLDVQTEKETIQPLAESLYSKTQGNAFHLKSYLQLLVEKQILTFSYITYSWTWDLERLDVELDYSANVVAVVLAKLEGLDASLRSLLILASSLPSTFDSSVLQTLLERRGKDTADLEKQLEVLVLEGLLVNAIGSTRYSFAHDRIQQAAMELLADDEDEQQRLSMEVGTILADIALSDNAEDWMIFASIDRLESCGYNDRDKMIQYYTIAAQRSAQTAAYGPAALYYGKAISVLRNIDREDENDIWKDRTEQCLDLFLAATEVEFTLGNYEIGNDYCQELLKHSESESHSIRATVALSDALANQQQAVLAMKKTQSVLRTLNEHPRHAGNPIDVMVRLMRTKSKLKKMSTDDILSLPLVVDPNILLAMRTLQSLVMQCGNTGKIILLLQGCMHMINLTLKKGLTPCSAAAFAGFSAINYKGLGDEKFGKKVMDMAQAVFKKVPGSSALVILFGASDVDAWYAPLSSLRTTFDNGFEHAMTQGDMFSGMVMFGMNVFVAFMIGSPLSLCRTESKILLTMLRQYNVDSFRVMFKPFDELMMCLTGEIEDPEKWVTDFEIPNKKRFDKSRTTEIVQGCLGRAICACWFGSFIQAERHIEGFRHFADHGGSFPEVIFGNFVGPLTYLKRYQQTKRRAYRVLAQRDYKRLKKLAKERGLNTLHKFYIVDAEYAATFEEKKSSSQDEIKAKYDKAIAASTKPGYIQDAALASELAGAYFNRVNDDFWAKHYLNQAARFYQEWGAKGKVRDLKETYGSMIEDSELDIAEMRTTRQPRFSLASRMDFGSVSKGMSTSSYIAEGSAAESGSMSLGLDDAVTAASSILA